MTRIFVFYHIIQNSLELKNELQWKKYHVHTWGYSILILTKNRGYLGFWKVSCHGVFFREGVWFFLHFLMNFYCTPLLKNHYLNTMMQKKMKYKEKDTLYLDSLNFWAILMQIASTCDGDFASSSSGSSSSSSEAKGESRTLPPCRCRRHCSMQ